MAVAAYLLDPLKSHYGYEDVAREHLGLMIEDKSELYIKVCYEAYTAQRGIRYPDETSGRSTDGQVVYGNRNAAGVYAF